MLGTFSINFQILCFHLDMANTAHWRQLRVKEIVKCIFKSNLTTSDRGTRHNSKRVDGWGEHCTLMGFVKRIAFWASCGVALRYPQRVRLRRVIQVSSEGLHKNWKPWPTHSLSTKAKFQRIWVMWEWCQERKLKNICLNVT